MNEAPPGHQLLLLSIPGRSERDSDRLRHLAAAIDDWSRVLDDAERVGAVALLGVALEEERATRPPSVTEAGRADLVRGTLRTLLATRVLSEALETLRRAAIEALVLKGVPLAHELYDPPGLRPIGDIDLLVRRVDRAAAIRALFGIGYRLPAGSLPLGFYFRHHFHVTLTRPGAGGLPIELHWDTQPRFSLSRIPSDALWARRRPIVCDDVEIPAPAREELFLYLAQHLLRHLIAFGPETAADPIAAMLEPARRGRLTWLADLILLARQEPGLDWARIDRLADAWGLVRELAGLRQYLAGLGLAPAPPGPSSMSAGAGEATLGTIRRLAAHFPTLARASGGLQLRPILIARLWRFAFPGPAWLRWRYSIAGDSGAARVAARGALHATGVAGAALGMAVELPIAWGQSRLGRLKTSRTLPESDRNAPGTSRNCPPRIT
ncbi:MAG TPA: nucleotidyltransferase family protein [Candidatus Polarisedimenticolia bacterium]|nr:nucleotidyltransferase family protein [Candidatus Polarisedimenticolia bacterium]